SDLEPDIETQARETSVEDPIETETALAQSVGSDLNLSQAFQAAERAARLAQTARTMAEWEQVGQGWLEAIALLRAVPPDSPFRVFAQQKAQEYQVNWAIASQRADSLSAPYVFPTLGNQTLDSQLANYLSYVAALGVPDILIVGSSRVLQGIDAQILQQQLARAGLPGLRVYNFGVNGLTAQGTNFILRQLLQPDQLPHVIIWGGNSRAFNSGRLDRTFQLITTSPGYRALQVGDRPGFNRPTASRVPTLKLDAIDANGFSAVATTFNASQYYKNFPKVPGRYDAAYTSFQLQGGVQDRNFQTLANWLNGQNKHLVFVNLPLSGDYLDPIRQAREQDFQRYLQLQGRLHNLPIVDLLKQWRQADRYFADPSHLNQVGAAAIATQLASDPRIPWSRFGLGGNTEIVERP
ncbi:MAG: hypothetical protein AAGF24_14940, partial [Cyanobacteria bacterium P01_H01_bin.121]